MALLRGAQRVGLAKHLGSIARGMPSVPPKQERQRLPDFLGAQAPRQGEVWLLEGCVMPELFGRVNRATAKLLTLAGYDVRVPKPRLCCGALHAHAGMGETARDLARDWLDQAERIGMPDAILSASAGCGAHLAEFDRLLPDEPDRARQFSGRVCDASVFLARPENLRRIATELGELPGEWYPLTYDDPCHLCHGQGVRAEPRALLDAIPGMQRVELQDAEACCGSAGLHSLLHPREAQEQLAGKLVDLAQSGAKTLVTANPGCHMQWQTGQGGDSTAKPVYHLMEVLAMACEPQR